MRIGVDVDDTIADLHTAWLERIRQAHGTTISVEEWTCYDYLWTGPTGLTRDDALSHLTADIYGSVRPFEGAAEVMQSLRRMGHVIVYVTSCFDHAIEMAKQLWLLRHGFLLFGQGMDSGHLLSMQDKTNAPVDILVDDHIKHVEAFQGDAVLLTRPHNRHHYTRRPRVASLEQFANLVWERAAA